MPLTTHIRLKLNYSLNFLSAISLIYVSKWLFRQYPISSLTLTIINCFLSGLFASIALKCIPKISTNTQTSASRFKSVFRLLLISGLFCAFIIFSNLSLQLNTIGTYQLIKLQVPLTLMLIEYLQLRLRFNSPLLTKEHFRRNYSLSVLAAFGIIFLGTLVNTHSDLHFHPFGVIFACMSVICNAIYQLVVQGDKSSSFYERTRFLQIQSFTSTLILFPSWPFIDPLFDMNEYIFTDYSALILLLLCGLFAFVVNSSVIWCIKDDGALGYNMVGQWKTLVVICIGSALFGESFSIKQIIGILLATAGCLMYAYVTYRMKERHKHQQQSGISNI